MKGARVLKKSKKDKPVPTIKISKDGHLGKQSATIRFNDKTRRHDFCVSDGLIYSGPFNLCLYWAKKNGIKWDK